MLIAPTRALRWVPTTSSTSARGRNSRWRFARTWAGQRTTLVPPLRERYAGLPFAVDHLEIDGASHWGLVLNRRALDGMVPLVLAWLEEKCRLLPDA